MSEEFQVIAFIGFVGSIIAILYFFILRFI